jgi:putative endonuclease
MSAYVYIIKFVDSGRFYVGSTTDLKRRLYQHSHNHTRSTANLGKFELVFSQQIPDLKTARSAEKRIKFWKRRDFIEKIVEEGEISFLRIPNESP